MVSRRNDIGTTGADGEEILSSLEIVVVVVAEWSKEPEVGAAELELIRGVCSRPPGVNTEGILGGGMSKYTHFKSSAGGGSSQEVDCDD